MKINTIWCLLKFITKVLKIKPISQGFEIIHYTYIHKSISLALVQNLKSCSKRRVLEFVHILFQCAVFRTPFSLVIRAPKNLNIPLRKGVIDKRRKYKIS